MIPMPYLEVGSDDMARYAMMNDFEDYKDIFSSNLEKFVFDKNPTEYTIKTMDVQNFANLMTKLYGRSDVDDIVLSANNISHVGDLNAGDIIFLPDLQDVQAFYNKNRK